MPWPLVLALALLWPRAPPPFSTRQKGTLVPPVDGASRVGRCPTPLVVPSTPGAVPKPRGWCSSRGRGPISRCPPVGSSTAALGPDGRAGRRRPFHQAHGAGLRPGAGGGRGRRPGAPATLTGTGAVAAGLPGRPEPGGRALIWRCGWRSPVCRPWTASSGSWRARCSPPGRCWPCYSSSSWRVPPGPGSPGPGGGGVMPGLRCDVVVRAGRRRDAPAGYPSRDVRRRGPAGRAVRRRLRRRGPGDAGRAPQGVRPARLAWHRLVAPVRPAGRPGHRPGHAPMARSALPDGAPGRGSPAGGCPSGGAPPGDVLALPYYARPVGVACGSTTPTGRYWGCGLRPGGPASRPWLRSWWET